MSGHEAEKRRLDAELVRRGLAATRTQAQAAIAAGKVRVAGVTAAKAGALVGPDTEIEAEAAHPWASRGGLKLVHGLSEFGVDPAGRVCLDVGSSTGGFTDVLLSRGARRVVAVDVGRDQLLARLKQDARVVSLEGQDARTLTAEMVGEAPSLVVCDASFIGLAKVVARPLALAAQGADAVVLFKPQFEVGPDKVGKGGIVTDDTATELSAQAVARWFDEQGWEIVAWTDSPIRGGDGNRERLIHARRRAG
jgi:23S rRNA (cytidine1920-2'-O)/16S rRNA (cytidine1409-2'-O)-methyltransferase